jgi:hypothetical protein
MARRSHPALLLALVALASACTPSSAAGTDAGRDARARVSSTAGDGGGDLDGGATAAAMREPDAAPPDDTNLPAAASDELTARAKHLFEAVVRDNADLGTDMVFPRDAYIAAHDSADPGKAWDSKILGAFRRSVHTLHKRNARGALLEEGAQFVSFELGHAVLEITPKRKEWKRPLWRVHGSKINYTLDGKTQRLEINEMTSWRGAWYVTKLR